MNTINHPGSGFARPIHTNPMQGHYDGQELATAPTRACATTTHEFPSRSGDRLHYRDGRVTDLTGNPIPTTPRSPS